MILADKIIRLRKKNGWSQEELAEKMKVSRQAVSKWEGAQTVPDLEKILQLGELFGVSTDYLLKDEMESEEYTESGEDSSVRRVSLAEANVYLEQRKKASVMIAAATFLCILAPIPLILLSGAVEACQIPERYAVSVGLMALFLLAAAAVAIYLYCGFKNAAYKFLDTDAFDTEYGVRGMVTEKRKEYRSQYMLCNIIGTCLCVVSPIPLLLASFSENAFAVVGMVAVLMFLVGIGVILFILSGVRWASMQRLLKDGEFTAAEKKKSKMKEAIESVYWLVTTAVYLGWSFLSGDWHFTWIIWPIAAVLSAILAVVCNLFIEKGEE